MSTESYELKRLTEDGRRLIGDSFLRGEDLLNEDDLSEYVEPLPGNPTADLSALDTVVGRVVLKHSKYDTSMDAALASNVHQHLDITRRVAADPGLWHWLAVVRHPDFVRHRWEYHSEEAMREKFLGAGTDLYSNAIHRLWWIAELTHENDDYNRTDAVFSNQTIVNKVFDRWFARYRPAVVALCDELADEPSWVIDETTRRFNHALTNVQLEGLSQSDARELVQQILSEIYESKE
ncbi:hypothetical protein HAPAU_35670 [Halalkalicoccus paucihalophilus]|uniref:Uncharacterized protein n=1 Tax=Halalkalicoccus paucihalophilus TaxID=1008153 RepID=A0A151AAG3_9EURY|nr:DUF6339 family protein [Halalkalicoccus paucihalophilus]KYH24584.1 hypothetical protein HAPAU_35670 [Halalkalicoccus paucihalophilus]